MEPKSTSRASKNLLKHLFFRVYVYVHIQYRPYTLYIRPLRLTLKVFLLFIPERERVLRMRDFIRHFKHNQVYLPDNTQWHMWQFTITSKTVCKFINGYSEIHVLIEMLFSVMIRKQCSCIYHKMLFFCRFVLPCLKAGNCFIFTTSGCSHARARTRTRMMVFITEAREIDVDQ